MKKVLSLGLTVWIGTLFAYYPLKYQTAPLSKRPMSVQSPQSEISDEEAAYWNYWWTGVGDLGDWGVSNTGQGPIFPNASYIDECYYGQPPWAALRSGDRGYNAEYPKGSEQYYTYASGAWIGALYPIIEGRDTTWVPNVSKMAYSCDLGAMSVPEMENAGEAGNLAGAGLSMSTQCIPPNLPHEGLYLFKQPGLSKEDYQILWPFADTSINARRPEGTELKPAEGDIVSIEDTYAVCGDWIPVDDATCIWIMDTGKYDELGLGIRVEVRTYSWNYDYNKDYIYINYKVRNMNPFPLKDIYVSYFMDNDIGKGDRPQGYWDDMVGFDKELNLGYTYDADAFEPDWKAPAGYIGCLLVETPKEIGFTGFQIWPNGDTIDENGRDDLKYAAMAKTNFLTWEEPNDVRQLMNSGPIKELKPEEEISFTIAIVAAPTLPELKEKAKNAIVQFETGYLGFAPPYPPAFTLRPGDGRVYISWDDHAENYEDLMSKQKTFEGYRVYRSRSGVSDGWDLLADYDLAGSYTKDTVVTKYISGTSKATISFEDFESRAEGVYGDNQYTINFIDSTKYDSATGDTLRDKYIIYNVNKEEVYPYNSTAIKDGYGYSVYDEIGGTVYPAEPGYLSGSYIYIDGFYISIRDGEYDPEQPGADLSPNVRDVFTIKSYKGKPIGNQIGISHYLVDSTVTNGVTYYYSVTSYSKELAEYNVGSLESGKTGRQYWAIPRKEPVDMKQAGVDTVSHTKGTGNALVNVVVVEPDEITGDEYKINFYPEKGDTAEIIKYWKLTDTKTNKVLLDNITALSGEKSASIIDGFGVSVNAVLATGIDTETVYDTMKTGWIKYDSVRGGWIKGKPNYKFRYEITRPLLPHDYKIVFTEEGSEDLAGRHAPFEVIDSTLGKPAPFFWPSGADSVKVGDRLTICELFDSPFHPLFTMVAEVDTPPEPVPPTTGDIYYVKTLKKVTPEEEFTIKTTRTEELPSDSVSLDSVRVVPNPYYIRAIWDKSRVEQRIYFQGLPVDTTCTIRIFNAAGLLIREIKPDECNLDGGAKYWDLYTDEQLRAVSGLYIYQVTTKNGKSKVGKFVIIR